MQSAIGSIRLICQPPLHFSLLVISIFEKKKKVPSACQCWRARACQCLCVYVRTCGQRIGWMVDPTAGCDPAGRQEMDRFKNTSAASAAFLSSQFSAYFHLFSCFPAHFTSCPRGPFLKSLFCFLPPLLPNSFASFTADLCLRPITGPTHLIH